eukprot:403367671
MAVVYLHIEEFQQSDPNYVEELFQQADVLLFKNKNCNEAERLYQQILEVDPRNIDALNSISYCIKFRVLGFENEHIQNLNERQQISLYELLSPIYQQILRLDPDNIECNFNMGVMYLQQKQDLQGALGWFQRALRRDKIIRENIKKITNPSELAVYQQYLELNRPHVIKILYNLGMIYDRLGDISRASNYYRYAIAKCKEDNSLQSMHQSYYAKACTNYAVSLEKMGKRQEAIDLLNQLKEEFREEIRVLNNLGIISKRHGLMQEAQQAYEDAIKIDENCFFPNYNMGVFKASHPNHESDQEALKHFQKALDLARINKEDVYEINVLVNMALVHERQSQINEAIQCLQDALQLDPQNSKIQQKLEQLKSMINQQKHQQNKQNLEDKSISQPKQQKVESASQNKTKSHQYNNEENQKKTQHQQQIDNDQQLIPEDIKDNAINQTTGNSRQAHNFIEKEEIKRQKVNQSEQRVHNNNNHAKIMQEKQSNQNAGDEITVQMDQTSQHINLERQSQNTSQNYQDVERSQTQQSKLSTTRHQGVIGGNSSMMNNSGIITDNKRPQSGAHKLQALQQLDHTKLTAGLDTFLPKNLNDINVKDVQLPEKHLTLQVDQDIQESHQQVQLNDYQDELKDDQLEDHSHKQHLIDEHDILNSSHRSLKYSRLQSAQSTKHKQVEFDEQNSQKSLKHAHQNSDQEAHNQDIITPDKQNFKEHVNDQSMAYHDQEQINQDEIDIGNFVLWPKQQCLDVLEQYKQNPQLTGYDNFIKAHFRLGIIAISEKQLDRALEYLKKVDDQNEFRVMDVHLWMKIGETLYKMDRNQEALEYFRKASDFIKPEEDYLISMFIAKCLDKLKLYARSIEEYQKALQLYQEQQDEPLENSLLGNIHFRLGWAIIRNNNSLSSDKNKNDQSNPNIIENSIDMGIEHLRTANELILNNADIMHKLAGVLFKEKDESEESLQIMEKVLKIIPSNPEVHLLMGKIYDKKNNHLKAIESISQAIKQFATQNPNQPPKSNLFFLLAQSLEKQKDYKKCILNYKKCLTLDNKHFGSCIHLANLLANIGEGQRAAKYFKHAIRIDNDSVNARFGLAKTLQQFSENKDAPIEHFEMVLQKDTSHFKAATQLGILYLDREEYEKSAEYLKKALTVNKYYPLALVSMGNLLFETGHADEAIKYHKQALVINEKELQALIGLGNAFYDSSQPMEAINYYKRALAIDDQLSDVHYNLGNALYLVENIDEAVMHYREAINLNPKKAESYYNLGNALCVKNEYPNAVNAYQQALELDPKNAPALYNLGNAYYMLNQFTDAIKVYLRALDINEESAECHFNLASAYNDVQNYQGAIIHYKRAVELDENNTDAFVCLGGVFESVKDFDKAERYYRLVLQREKDNIKAIEALKKLKAGQQQQTSSKQLL